MKTILLLIALIFAANTAKAQLSGKAKIDSLLNEIPNIKEDTNAVNLYLALASEYASINPDEGIKYGEKGLKIAKALKWELGKGKCFTSLGILYSIKESNYSKAIEYFQEALQIYTKVKNLKMMINHLQTIGDLYHKQLKYIEAEKHYNQALDVNKSDKLINEKGKTYKRIAFLYRDQGDFTKSNDYYYKALKIFEALDDKQNIAGELHNIANNYNELSNYAKALDYLHRALKINEELGNLQWKSYNLAAIASVYSQLSDYSKAIEYNQKALKIFEETGNKYGIAGMLHNIGVGYTDNSEHEKAKEYYLKAMKMNEEMGNLTWLSNNYNALGNVYRNQEDYSTAFEYFEKALEISEKLGDKSGIAARLESIGLFYLSLSQDSSINESANNEVLLSNKDLNLANSLKYIKKALTLQIETGELKSQSNNYKLLSLIYKQQGDFQNALETFEEHKKLQDSIFSLDRQKEIANLESKRELEVKETENLLLHKEYKNQELLLKNQSLELMSSQSFLKLLENEKELQHLDYLREQAENQEKSKQIELSMVRIELQNSQLEKLNNEKEIKDAQLRNNRLSRNFYIIGIIIFLLAFIIAYKRFKEKKKLSETLSFQKQEVEKAKKESDELLLNILPFKIAEELKEKGHSDAQLIDHVTVLFTDFKGFTSLSEQVTAKELVADLHECFSSFDRICEKYGIEKIKTIGDAYMAAGGLPTPNATHAKDAVMAALEICNFIEKGKAEKIAAGLPYFEIRIGIHTGPVVAGIVGVKKFQYDIWGDTVNTASRMESSGEVGKVNISEATYARVKDDFNCTFRGEIEAKGKGKLGMWFVSGPKEDNRTSPIAEPFGKSANENQTSPS
jgi:adenylate cyclase